ncbi:hypothetical protein WK56_00635 [Burkholderia ubonensis]|nr:hypothetical protein WK56_00635 [Burkholderia ubonensis]
MLSFPTRLVFDIQEFDGRAGVVAAVQFATQTRRFFEAAHVKSERDKGIVLMLIEGYVDRLLDASFDCYDIAVKKCLSLRDGYPRARTAVRARLIGILSID